MVQWHDSSRCDTLEKMRSFSCTSLFVWGGSKKLCFNKIWVSWKPGQATGEILYTPYWAILFDVKAQASHTLRDGYWISVRFLHMNVLSPFH